MLLNLSHYSKVHGLLLENKSRTINGYDFEKGSDWIKQNFLAGKPNHFIFGSFFEDELVSICSMIKDFPNKSSAYIGNVFYKPKFTKERIKVMASEEAYKKAVDEGCTQVFSCVLEKRFESQWNLVTRYSEYMKLFKSEVYQRIPAGTLPKENWVQFLMGYHKSPENCIVRRAVYQGF